jgi:nucleolar protein 6
LTHKSDPRAPEKAYLVGQSRGIAFVEFPSSLAIQAALKLHHTELGGNRINVALTAGGGGSTGERKKKIDERNQRVGEQRVKRKERESEGVEGEEQDEDIAAETQDGQPLKKKLKARGGRRGKAVSLSASFRECDAMLSVYAQPFSGQ